MYWQLVPGGPSSAGGGVGAREEGVTVPSWAEVRTEWVDSG